MNITKYNIYNPLNVTIPTKKRKFMDETWNGYAYRCLPMTVANGFGWTVLNNHRFTVKWNGGNQLTDTIILYDKLADGKNPYNPAVSHFGTGILTFNVGFLIRTPEKINLYVKGPANSPKRGITALEGIVETDWLNFTFTMNWKITEPNYEIVFEKDEPICTFFPYPRNYIEQFDAISKNITLDPDVHKKYTEYAKSRSEYNANLKTNGAKGQRDYLRGVDKEGNSFDDHQNSINAKPFIEVNE